MVQPPTPAASGDDNSAELYGLEELLALASEQLGEEITPRTVRLYATQGLIDRPGKEGRSAVYSRRHLLQLLLIRSLAQRGLSLSAIAPLIIRSDGELEQQLADLGEMAPVPQDNSALDYLRSIKTSKESMNSESFEVDSDSIASHASSSSLLPLLGAPISAALSFTRASLQRSSGSRQATNRWHRFSLAPGVELQINDSVSIPPAGPRRLHWLKRLTDRLIEQLDDNQR
jgi:DNA-binding transcriptional MerR regulator